MMGAIYNKVDSYKTSRKLITSGFFAITKL